MSRTPEERTKLKKELMPLFKAKRTICEVTLHDASHIVVNKIHKQVYFVDDSELRLMCKLMSSGLMVWESEIEETIRTKYDALMNYPYGKRRSSQISSPSAEDGMRYSARADIRIVQESQR